MPLRIFLLLFLVSLELFAGPYLRTISFQSADIISQEKNRFLLETHFFSPYPSSINTSFSFNSAFSKNSELGLFFGLGNDVSFQGGASYKTLIFPALSFSIDSRLFRFDEKTMTSLSTALYLGRFTRSQVASHHVYACLPIGLLFNSHPFKNYRFLIEPQIGLGSSFFKLPKIQFWIKMGFDLMGQKLSFLSLGLGFEHEKFKEDSLF